MLRRKEIGQRDIDYVNSLVKKLNVNRTRILHVDVTDSDPYVICIKQHEIIFCKLSIVKLKIGDTLEYFIFIHHLIDKPVSRKALLNLFANTYSKYFYGVVLAHNVRTDLLVYKKDYTFIPKEFRHYDNKILNEGDDINAKLV